MLHYHAHCNVVLEQIEIDKKNPADVARFVITGQRSCLTQKLYALSASYMMLERNTYILIETDRQSVSQ